LNPRRILPLIAITSAAWIAASAQAQWSTSAASPLPLADRTGDQVQPKVSPTPDGGAYVSWYDNSTGGYDVYLQRVDASGIEQWPHNGVLIADRSVSSTVDYSLVTDQGGNAVIAFNDDRFGTGKITIQKVSPTGTLMFNGSQGLQIADAATNTSPPTVAVLADGNYGVMWNGVTTGIVTILQKVDSTSGALMWGPSGITQGDWLGLNRWVETSDMQSDGAGGAIVLFVRCSGTSCNSSNKQLFAQRYDATGVPVWNAGVPVTVFAGTSSIQNGSFPRFVTDGAGGAVFGWYEVGGSRNSYIQHVLANGTLKFANPVATTGATPGRIRVVQAYNYNPATGDYYAAFDECDGSTQSNHALNVQRIDTNGALQWGNDGLSLRSPEGFFQSFGISVQPAAGGCTVVWTWMDNTNHGYTYAARANDEGSVGWNEQVTSTYQGLTNRMTSALSTQGFCIVAVGAAGSGSQDIQGIRLNGDGSLGNPVSHCGTADFNCDGDVGTDADIESFFACLAGTCPGAPCANTADFNADGDIGTDADIEAFFRVLGGGTC
jgi:hypothetical protein